MAEFWLKALGMGARGEQMPDNWRNIDVLTRHVTFKRQSSFKPGDKVVYYASGKGLIFAEGNVTSSPYYFKEEGTESNWPWRADVDVQSSVDFIPRGASLDDASVDGRDLKRSIRQKSHIRLSESEYEAAVEAVRTRATYRQ
jgi:hypothetical protein